MRCSPNSFQTTYLRLQISLGRKNSIETDNLFFAIIIPFIPFEVISTNINTFLHSFPPLSETPDKLMQWNVIDNIRDLLK